MKDNRKMIGDGIIPVTYSRTFICPKCIKVHRVESDRDNLDLKQMQRVQKCRGGKR